MLKVLAAAAAIALVGVAGVANASEGQTKGTANEPVELTKAEMDTVTAGAYGSSGFTYTRSINMGSYTLVYDSRTWSRVSK